MQRHKWAPVLASFGVLLLAGVGLLGQSITIPNTFVNGTVADATQVNANFSALSSNAVNRNGGTMLGTLNTRALTPTSDATYDLATSLLRFRDGWFSRNGSFAGTLAVTGAVTFTTPLAVTGGGTGLAVGTSGGVPYFSSTTTLASSALLTQHGVLVGGGAGAAPVALAALTTGQLHYGSTGADPVAATPASSKSTPADQAGNATATFKMNGSGCTITPVATGRVVLSMMFNLAQSTINDQALAKLAYGTGVAPANATAAAGTVATGTFSLTAPATGNYPFPASFTVPITGLTLNTAVWFDLQVAEAVGGTATVTGMTCGAWEF